MLKDGFVWRVYDMYNNGHFIKEYKSEKAAINFAQHKSIYYEVRKVYVKYVDWDLYY